MRGGIRTKKDRDELVGLIMYSLMQDTSGLTE